MKSKVNVVELIGSLPVHKVIFATALITASPSVFAKSGDDSSGLFWFAVIGLVVAYGFIEKYAKDKIEKGLERRKGEIQAEGERQREMAARAAEGERIKSLRQAESLIREINQKQSDMVSMTMAFENNYIQGRKWLAEYIAEAFAAPEAAIARSLVNKKQPAQKAADEVRRVSSEKKELRARLKYLEYAIKTYHEYYPVLDEYSDDILNEQATLDLEDDDDQNADRVSRYISKEEYSLLSTVQRNQLALDKWKARRKSNVEIGRIYERYLGWIYENDGWSVNFVGALEGVEDMGRDLLCVKGGEVHVVQAKYWSKHKTIHEKHIFQLYGTSRLVSYTYPSLQDKRICPVFATTTSLSDTALWAAKELGVHVMNMDMDHEYPVIKCNINGDNRIYHLPFDQQYDRVRIIPENGELYVSTVMEAEKHGFRRAKRHHIS